MSDQNYWKQNLEQLADIGSKLTTYERSVINLIASDNAYPDAAANNPVYNGHIIQEGLVGKRPFAGAALHDAFEEAAARIACEVFQAEHANLQPHSCSQANQVVYHALLMPGDTVLSLDFQAGGHLTHGLKYNFSGRHFKFFHYGVIENGDIDYETAQKIALEQKPKLIVCGSSAYPRLFDAVALRKIADSVGAKLMFDLSHESGLIAGKALPNIVEMADVVTMSMDKTLRGPFGGIILCRKELADKVDKAVHPGTQSSFPVRRIASMAQSLVLTQLDDFKKYARNVLLNAKVLENAFSKDLLFTGGTDKHYVIVNVRESFGITGTEAEQRLESVGILTSRQSMPSDPSRKMSEAGGLRLGTAWATSRGYTSSDFENVATCIKQALSQDIGDPVVFDALQRKVSSIASTQRKDDVWAVPGRR